MTIRRKGWLVLFIASVMLPMSWGCDDNHPINREEHIVGSGVIVSQQRSPGSFADLRIVGIAKVYVRQDAGDSVRVEADDNIINRVTSSVSQGVLTVGLTNGSYTNVTVNIYATMTTVHSLSIDGTGDIVTTNSIQTDRVSCSIIGAGSMTLYGATADETVVIAGAGSIHNFGLASSRCSATIAGTGSIEVNASQRLDALVSGVGTITYDGNPALVNATTTGVGSTQPR